MKNFLIVLLGPTGVGKTDTSIELARRFNCDIISADSRQFYREMRIGTAVPEETQLKAVKHHFIRFLPVTDYYSASLFERDVLSLLDSLFENTNVVLMTGGSGLYIDAVCSGIDEIPDIEPAIRQGLKKRYREEGIESLRLDLKVLDPEYYARTDLKNPKRIMRALEICEATGRSYSSFLRREKRIRDFGILKVGLERPRGELYSMIESRVDRMIGEGLEDEARGLHPVRELNALNSVGYREFFDYFEGKTTREKAIELIKRNSRRYAKRQITWWGRDKDIRWFHPDNVKEMIEYIEISMASSTS
ncbi:MAG: tRNA (adenosine(37)-N6)-dimethylallyltransferase MiaA [Bacteroidales bacterium]|nr:tRNA (adenosine(37)-N6)-dimethylallyltransferase MiaA [Bacteroidales bacterium]